MNRSVLICGHATVLLALLILALPESTTSASAQTARPRRPWLDLTPAPLLTLPGDVDSNSPLVWERLGSTLRLFVVTSWGGQPSVAAGPAAQRLGRAIPITLEPWPGGGVWMEAIVPDVDGTWYGYYHNEVPAPACPDAEQVSPRIGAARSRDFGRTWESLGIVLEAPPGQAECGTGNTYFNGGVGDFSVVVSPDHRDLYFFYSAYPRAGVRQGIAVARLAWADRDDPTGRMSVWRGGPVWAPALMIPQADGTRRPFYPTGLPFLRAAEPFHTPGASADVFWGPSVHWNTHLERYVMLLNRAFDEAWSQEGIYVSFSDSLQDPDAWSIPERIQEGGLWYPQVVGLEPGLGTDKTAGEVARFFTGGRSTEFVRFLK